METMVVSRNRGCKFVVLQKGGSGMKGGAGETVGGIAGGAAAASLGVGVGASTFVGSGGGGGGIAGPAA